MRHLSIPPACVRSLRFGPNGRTLYLLANGAYFDAYGANINLIEKAIRFDTATGEITGDWPLSVHGSTIAVFTPDFQWVYFSQSVAVSGRDLDLQRIHLSTGRVEPVLAEGLGSEWAAAFTPNGHILAVSGIGWRSDTGWQHHVYRLDVWHLRELDPLEIHAVCLEYSPDGRFLATGGDRVVVWDGKRPVAHFPGGAAALTWSVAGQLAWGQADELFVTTYPGNEPPLRLEPTGGDVTSLAFSPDARLLVSGSGTGTCAVHETGTGRALGVFDWGVGPVRAVAVSPDGLTCAAGGDAGRVVVWDVEP